MRLSCLAAGLSLTFVSVCAGNSWHDDSHYVRVGPRTGYYVLRDGSQLSRRLGLDDSPYADTAEPLRHGYGKDVLAFRFDLAGRLNLAPAYIANAKLNEFYTRRIGSLIRSRTSLREVKQMFGNPQAISKRRDGFVYYYTLDVFNPFEQFDGRR